MRRALLSLILLAMVALPSPSQAGLLGGQTSVVLPCIYNATIYAVVGPPYGGAFVWTTATKTYPFGAPRRPGQWLLGLTGVPYFCIYQIAPLITFPAISITMMGSSH
jgi:hypothetical protein